MQKYFETIKARNKHVKEKKAKGHRATVKQIILEDTKKVIWGVASWKSWRDQENKEKAEMKRKVKSLERKVAKLEGSTRPIRRAYRPKPKKR